MENSKFERDMEGRVPNDDFFAKWARETKETRADLLKRHEQEKRTLVDNQGEDFEDLAMGLTEEMPLKVEYQHKLQDKILKRTQTKEITAFDRVEKFRAKIAAQHKAVKANKNKFNPM